MRTLAIFGTDISGKQPWWDWHYPEENPILDDTHHFDRAHRPSMEAQYRDMAEIARFDGMAIGCRGKEDAGFAHFQLWRDVMRAAPNGGPTLMPWCDTGAMTDYHNYGIPKEQKTPFDFNNAEHVAGYFPQVLAPYFRTFPEGGNFSNPIRWERTADGRIVIAFWGISKDIGHGIRNQQYAQRLLDNITQRMKDEGLGVPAFIIDDSWPDHITAWAKHAWFDPGQNRPWTVHTFNGIKTGVLVKGFADPWDHEPPHRRIDPLDGKVLDDGFAAMRAAKADIVLYESYNNRHESAGIYPTKKWGDLFLKIVRRHIELTTGVAPSPEPITPQPEPLPTGGPMIALTEITDAVFYDDLIPGHTPGTYALIVGVENGRKKIGSLRDTGEWGFRYLDDPDMQMPDKWESGRKIGKFLVFKTNQHVKMFFIAAENI